MAIAADCKSVVGRHRWFESIHSHTHFAEVAQLVEHQPSKLRVAGSNPVFRSLDISRCSSGVERFLGKEKVTGSIPVIGSLLTTSFFGFNHLILKKNGKGEFRAEQTALEYRYHWSR